MFPALWQVPWGSRSLRVTIPQIQVHLSGFCPGHDVLELVRPVVPYTLALSPKCSRLVVSPASCRSMASQASCRRVALRPRLRSPSQTRLRSPSQITQNTTASNQGHLSSRNHRLINHYCNGRSLSGMGLTRERWCCTGRWLSRLDINTCMPDEYKKRYIIVALL